MITYKEFTEDILFYSVSKKISSKDRREIYNRLIEKLNPKNTQETFFRIQSKSRINLNGVEYPSWKLDIAFHTIDEAIKHPVTMNEYNDTWEIVELRVC